MIYTGQLDGTKGTEILEQTDLLTYKLYSINKTLTLKNIPMRFQNQYQVSKVLKNSHNKSTLNTWTVAFTLCIQFH